MSKKRLSSCFSELLSVSKCKRIIRPLVSKIHALADINNKYPLILELRIPLDSHIQEQSLTKLKVYQGSSRPSSREGSLKPTLEKKPTLRHEYDNDMSSDEDCDLTFVLPDEEQAKADKSKLNSKQDNETFFRFLNPKDGHERLQSLKPFISDELFQSYCEIFTIFKNVVNALCAVTETEQAAVSKLSSLCSFKYGKSIASFTKSTYYSFNRTQLFNPNEIPLHLQELHGLLHDDIDNLLDIEPNVISQTYRANFLIGYVIHLIVFNLQLILYLLIPSLIHWLNDEFRLTRDFRFKSIMRCLFDEFWHYGIDDLKDVKDQRLLALIDVSVCTKSFELFWVLYKVGYWKRFIDSLQLQSDTDGCKSYDSLVLKVLTINNRLKIKEFNNFTGTASKSILEHEVYPLIKRNPQNPFINLILASVITQIMIGLRSDLAASKSSYETIEFLIEYYENIVKFIQMWLEFPGDMSAPMTYNSLYPGNEEIFEALSKFGIYMHAKCDRYIEHFTRYIERSSNENYEKLVGLLYDLNYLISRINLLNIYINVMRSFFLETNDELSLGVHSPKDLCDFFFELMANMERNIRSSKDFNEFLLWLYDKQEIKILNFTRLCFKAFYGEFNQLKDSSVYDLYYILFDEENGSYSSELDSEDEIRLNDSSLYEMY